MFRQRHQTVADRQQQQTDQARIQRGPTSRQRLSAPAQERQQNQPGQRKRSPASIIGGQLSTPRRMAK